MPLELSILSIILLFYLVYYKSNKFVLSLLRNMQTREIWWLAALMSLENFTINISMAVKSKWIKCKWDRNFKWAFE